MSASGRKLPFDLLNIGRPERPLLVKADIQPGIPENSLSNVRFTPKSGH
jgi:hypothetical protein